MGVYLHCLVCRVRKSEKNRLYLTNCGHIFCKACIEARGTTCAMCKNTAKFVEISPNLPKDVRFLFENPLNVIQKSKKAVKFQTDQGLHYLDSRRKFLDQYEMMKKESAKIDDAIKSLEYYSFKEEDLIKRLKVMMEGNKKIYNHNQSFTESIFDSPNVTNASFLKHFGETPNQNVNFFKQSPIPMDVEVQPQNLVTPSQEQKLLQRFRDSNKPSSPVTLPQPVDPAPPQVPTLPQPRKPAPTFQYTSKKDLERALPQIQKRRSPKEVPLFKQVMTKHFTETTGRGQPSYQTMPSFSHPSQNNRGFIPNVFQNQQRRP